jgi:hypothetical protein
MRASSLLRGLASLLLVGGLVGAGPARAQIETEVSDVTGTKRIESRGMRSLHAPQYDGSHASFRAAYVNDPGEGTRWTLTVYGFTETTTPVGRANQFLVEADGQLFEPARLTSKTREVDGTLLEIKRAAFSRSAFAAIAGAQTVTISIGPTQFTAIHARRADLRRILDRVPNSTTPPTASTDSSGGR